MNEAQTGVGFDSFLLSLITFLRHSSLGLVVGPDWQLIRNPGCPSGTLERWWKGRIEWVVGDHWSIRYGDRYGYWSASQLRGKRISKIRGRTGIKNEMELIGCRAKSQ